MSLLKGMDNHDIVVEDIEVMYDFYVNTLGMTPQYPFDPADGWFAASAGDTTLYFFKGTGTHPPRLSVDTEQNPPGIESLTFLVDDIHEAIEAFDGKVEWAGPAEKWEHENGAWYHYRFFYDPEGNKMSLSEAHPVRG
jgi:catechol 2,3-dioxygenase-like lactoylglutathione lyase family enzyme